MVYRGLDRGSTGACDPVSYFSICRAWRSCGDESLLRSPLSPRPVRGATYFDVGWALVLPCCSPWGRAVLPTEGEANESVLGLIWDNHGGQRHTEPTCLRGSILARNVPGRVGALRRARHLLHSLCGSCRRESRRPTLFHKFPQFRWSGRALE